MELKFKNGIEIMTIDCSGANPYIGLMDKNGREIYLDDEVQTFFGKRKVSFKYGAFGFIYGNNYAFESFYSLISMGEFSLIDNKIQEIEVIDA